MKVMLDTGVLISLACATRPMHERAVRCLQLLKERKDLIVVSPLALSEYAVQNDVGMLMKCVGVDNIPLYNQLHAMKAATFRLRLKGKERRDDNNRRDVVINDIQIMAQADIERVDVVLTEDRATFLKNARTLKEEGLTMITAVNLLDKDEVVQTLNLGQLEFDM